MFTVAVRRHVMVAHSLKDPVFGPAQKLHGATYVVDAEFGAAQLSKANIVLDIGWAGRVLEEVLGPLEYQNLDELPVFAGILTTTEFLCQYIHREICTKVGEEFQGELKVTLTESPSAWASYEAPVRKDS
ncbi:MAG: 6-carboxytetrahydropterin synthase [Haliscomenobacter sp.]|nr:6-carboxytetrahydropterin synthase [Haliscomenobacter sp.]MBP9077112.1 6-carboxytetrahydropterin synthase [Haliscomenobacter sp.]